MFGLTDTDLEIVVSILRSHTEIDTALIFGSRAMGNYKPGSDIDLALQGTAVNDNLADTINIELNERSPLPYKFDVIAYTNELSTALKKHIDTHGVIFYQRQTPS